VIVIVNPAAGAGSTGRRWPPVAKHLLEEGYRFEEVVTTRPGEAADVARRAADEGRSVVVAVGGDGTVNEVVNGLLTAARDSRPALGVIPTGTGTDLCRTFGIPKDLLLAANLLLHGAGRRIDAGRVTCLGPKGATTRYFLNIADAGIGGDVADFVNGGFKFINGELTFSVAAVITLFRWQNRRLSLQLDGQAREVTAQQVVVANCQYYGGGMRIAPHALPDDGLFDVIIHGDLGAFETIRLLGKVRQGTHLSHPKIERLQARRVEISCDRPVGVDADGERPGALPAQFEIVPGAIELRVPPP
jgi:diacylglycerol kinase (ATP)